MRIGVVYLGRRGAGPALALEAASALHQHADVFAVISRGVENFALWQREGLPFFSTPTYESGLQALGSLVNQKQAGRVAERIANLMPDVLLFPMFHPWNALVQRRLAQIPAVVLVHDPLPHPGLRDQVYHRLQRQSVRLARRCVLLSESLLPALVAQGIPAAQVDVIPHPTYAYFHRYDPAPGADDAARLLFFGRIEPYKGLEVLLKAYRGLPEPPGLVVAGEGSLSAYSALLDGLAQVQVENRWVADAEVPRFFRPGRIVVLPYTSATQSGVIEIAAAYGLPVVATRVGGIPEQVRDGETGLLVEAGDVEGLRAAVWRLLEDPALAQRLGSRLKAEANAQRGWEVTAKKLLASCQRAAGLSE
jgi:glycosyltransferase involved in cell wall biosynthesis